MDTRTRGATAWRAALALGGMLTLGSAAVPAAAQARPNIVMFLVDDATASLTGRMPNVKQLIINRGATFTHAYYNDPLCSPSRTTLLTGQYVQNTGVDDNTTPKYQRFVSRGKDKNTVATWLHDAGYRTALVGKYENGYGNIASDASYIPPGWDYWVARLTGGLYYNYSLSINGQSAAFGSTTSDYSTSVYERYALDFLQRQTADQPFFLYIPVGAPHVPTEALSTDAASVSQTLRAPRDPAFNEQDVSDKPAYVRTRSLMSSSFISDLDRRYRLEMQALIAVDRLVRHVYQELVALGVADNTYLVFSNDNGWMWGDHRRPGGKGYPYDEVLRMPLYVAGPGIAAGRRIGALVDNADLAPTFVAWAGISPRVSTDGRSLAGVLAGRPFTRKSMPIYFLEAVDSKAPTWRGVRAVRYDYQEYATGERELYDLSVDPYQLTNIAKTADPTFVDKLSTLAATLNGCSGPTCAAAEDAPVPSSSR